jgi:hypothetical protein
MGRYSCGLFLPGRPSSGRRERTVHTQGLGTAISPQFALRNAPVNVPFVSVFVLLWPPNSGWAYAHESAFGLAFGFTLL